MISYSAITGSLGNIGDRYNLAGYKGELPLAAKVRALAEIGPLDGIELSQAETEGMTSGQVHSLLNSHGLRIAALGVDLTSDPCWQLGSLTHRDAAVRQKAVDKLKQTIDFAAEVGAGMINVWLGQDGFDYPFQVDYGRQWAWAVENLAACARHNPGVKLALEAKLREPRNRSFLDSTATALVLADDIGEPNAGLCVDVGHVLQEGKNMSQAVVYAHAHGKLFNLHVNDNYGGWDDDMIVGSVRHAEFIELCYYLHKIGYEGWCSVDIFPYRENSIRAVEESILNMQFFYDFVARIGAEGFKACFEGDACDYSRLLRETLFRG